MRLRSIVFFLTLSLLGCQSGPILDQVEEVRLTNGMKFLLLHKGETPVFSASIRFKVGALDEGDKEMGIAHLVEHMAFKGTKEIGTKDYKAEKVILDQIEEVGQKLSLEYAKGKEQDFKKIKEYRASLKNLYEAEKQYIIPEDLSDRMRQRGVVRKNATTSFDFTTYFEDFPLDQLEFWAKIESERVFSPVFREFYEERDVVLEEYRMRVENSPWGKLAHALLGEAFHLSPYRRSVIGNPNTLLTITRTDAENFFQKHYRPSQAIGVIVGGIDLNRTKAILRRYFEKIPTGEELPLTSYPEERPQEARREVTVVKEAAPILMLAYHKPAPPNPDHYVLELLSTILTNGQTSRLYRHLVLEKKMASDVGSDSSFPGERLSNLLILTATPLAPFSPREIEGEIEAVLEDLRRTPVSEEELQRAKTKERASLIWDLKSNHGLASELSYYEALGDWRYLKTYGDNIEAVSAGDIQRVVIHYLQAERATAAYLVKGRGS